MEIKDMIELMKAVSDNSLTVFELEQGDVKLTMKREKKVVAAYAAGTGLAVQQMPAEEPVFEETVRTGGTPVTGNMIVSPLVGTFYASPAPDVENFVKVGDHVKKGQVVGIVEAMKLMNEIESEFDGVVEEILVSNEDTVEYGQPLFRIG
ncbi:MAG: acetyl-CoA carboxylase biotin carboxyl carrier protein [Lachnospiraceae bacterium]|nr:acetyl-CoA carboxylase biotin carboxyl carrier protein [Lachnospiraceae bacterium]